MHHPPPTPADPRAAFVEGDDAAPAGDASQRVFAGHSHPRVEADASNVPLVVLPGFGNNSADYLAPFGNEEAGLVSALEVRRLVPA